MLHDSLCHQFMNACVNVLQITIFTLVKPGFLSSQQWRKVHCVSLRTASEKAGACWFPGTTRASSTNVLTSLQHHYIHIITVSSILSIITGYVFFCFKANIKVTLFVCRDGGAGGATTNVSCPKTFFLVNTVYTNNVHINEIWYFLFNSSTLNWFRARFYL